MMRTGVIEAESPNSSIVAYMRAWTEWFAFTAFPLVAGTFGPLSTALNICALAEPWRLDLNTGEFVGDPILYHVHRAYS
jgi:hypothetical protein